MRKKAKYPEKEFNLLIKQKLFLYDDPLFPINLHLMEQISWCYSFLNEIHETTQCRDHVSVCPCQSFVCETAEEISITFGLEVFLLDDVGRNLLYRKFIPQSKWRPTRPLFLRRLFTVWKII